MITNRNTILNCWFMALALTGCELLPGSSNGDAGSAGPTVVEVECDDDDSVVDSEDVDGDGAVDEEDIGAADDDDSFGGGAADDDDGGADDGAEDDSSEEEPELDTDGDGITNGDEGNVDTDGDGHEDWQDTDSDNDGISDADEGTVDTDGDGISDYVDSDSDNDGISDAEEGDVDSDGDGEPDYVDSDSDNDGSSDLIEDVVGTDPTDPTDNPPDNGDQVIDVTSETTVSTDLITTTTNYQQLDVWFLMDRTCSMSAEIEAMADAMVDIVDSLTCESSGATCDEDAACDSDEVCGWQGECIEDPALVGCVPSFWSGTGTYQDAGFSVTNLASINSDAALTASMFPTSIAGGSDENLFQAAACVADPAACGPAVTLDCAAYGIGCPGYRDDSVRVLVQVTDEDDQSSPQTYNAAMAGAALQSQDIEYIGIDCDTNSMGLADLQAVATEAGSFDADGNPLVFSGVGSEVVPAVTEAIQTLVEDVPVEVTVTATDLPGDSGDSLVFLDYFEVVSGVDGCTDAPALDSDGDGFAETYTSVLPGTTVCWSFNVDNSTAVIPTDEVQTFDMLLTITGNNAVLDEYTITFVVGPGS
ncbi:MAG: hypothetical protein CMP23_10295 [Rickettsiales bacterium]|nr:hypothetical protein [Rickettsiales bacterium]